MSKYISNGRKKAIEDLVLDILDTCENENLSFIGLLDKFKIRHYTNFNYPDDSLVTSDGKKYIFNYPRIFKATEEFSNARELGHLLLHYDRINRSEKIMDYEKDYFAELFTDISKPKYYLLSLIETYAFLASRSDFRKIYFIPDKDYDKYLEKIIMAVEHFPTGVYRKRRNFLNRNKFNKEKLPFKEKIKKIFLD